MLVHASTNLLLPNHLALPLMKIMIMIICIILISFIDRSVLLVRGSVLYVYSFICRYGHVQTDDDPKHVVV